MKVQVAERCPIGIADSGEWRMDRIPRQRYGWHLCVWRQRLMNGTDRKGGHPDWP
jgi:hypothetical protein